MAQKFIDKNKAQSLVIQSVYFPKKDQEIHGLLSKVLSYEHVLFSDGSDNPEYIDKIKKDTLYSAFDYRIYEELKVIKKELRKEKAQTNLMQMLAVDEEGNPVQNQEGYEIEDDFSMSVSMDYDYEQRQYLDDDQIEDILDQQQRRAMELDDEEDKKQQEFFV